MRNEYVIIIIFINLTGQTPESTPILSSGITGLPLWRPASERP